MNKNPLISAQIALSLVSCRKNGNKALKFPGRNAFIVISLLYFIALQENTHAQLSVRNWTHFRGSHSNGYADDKSYPLEWNDTTNIEWKTAIPGKGWSSPVVYGDLVWLTTSTDDGSELSVVCLDFITGKILHFEKIFEPDSVYRIHPVNSHATPTPCIEAGFVYIHFGRYGTACINTESRELVWKRTDLICDHIQGPGSSPVLHGNKLILHLEGSDVQYLVALDKRTGETIWETHRPAELYDILDPIGKKAYTTPLIMNVRGRELLISNGSAVCIAYDVETGEEIWRIIRGEDTSVAMPFNYDGIVYFYSSLTKPPEGERYSWLIAANPDGIGDIAATNIIWEMKAPILQLSTPVVKDGLIYTIDSRSDMFCLDAYTGEIIWTERMKGKFNSSPVAASGNIYFNSTQGITYVFKEGREMMILAENKLDGEIWATPAFIDGAVLLRTSKFLYKISNTFSEHGAEPHSISTLATTEYEPAPTIYKIINGQSLDLEVDIPTGSASAPVILYVHSWSGNKNQLKAYSSRLAQEGVAGVRINYRKLSEGHSFEQAISDVRDALQWIRDHAEEYRFDTSRLGIAGASAGGLLSSLVALENPDCRIYIGFNGGYDLVQRDGSNWPPEDRMETLLGGKNTKKARQKWSAVHHIPAGTLPAVLLLHGTKDETITISVARRFQEALIKHGGIAELGALEGEEHGFFNAGQPRFPEIYKMVYHHVLKYLMDREQ